MERSRRTLLRGAAVAVGVAALSGALAIGRAQASQFPTRAIPGAQEFGGAWMVPRGFKWTRQKPGPKTKKAQRNAK